MARRTKPTKPQDRAFLRPQVLATEQVSPNFHRVTLGGPALCHFTPLGLDQWFRLFLPGPDGHLHLPTVTNNLWYAQYMLMPKNTRPVGRNYTVRRYRPGGPHSDGPEIDVDFALHRDSTGHLGAAAAWATTATAGDEVGLLDEGVTYQPSEGARWQLLLGDETAVPAILAILEGAPRDLRAQVLLEVQHRDDAQEVDLPAGVDLRWLARSDGGPGALAALADTSLPDGPGYAFIAGGHKLATSARRHLVNDRSLAKDAVTFTGYWR